jgi:hypothetical protein
MTVLACAVWTIGGGEVRRETGECDSAYLGPHTVFAAPNGIYALHG